MIGHGVCLGGGLGVHNHGFAFEHSHRFAPEDGVHMG